MYIVALYLPVHDEEIVNRVKGEVKRLLMIRYASTMLQVAAVPRSAAGRSTLEEDSPAAVAGKLKFVIDYIVLCAVGGITCCTVLPSTRHKCTYPPYPSKTGRHLIHLLPQMLIAVRWLHTEMVYVPDGHPSK